MFFEAKDFFTGLKSIKCGKQMAFSQTQFFASQTHAKQQRMVESFEKLGISNIDQAVCRESAREIIFFTREHGLVYRISKADFYDKMHGSQVQPVGWSKLDDDYNIMIYAGEKLVENYVGHDYEILDALEIGEDALIENDKTADIPFKDFFHNIIRADGFRSWDENLRNVGYFESPYGDLPIMIDTDNITYDGDKGLMKGKFDALLDQGFSPAQALVQMVAMNTSDTRYKANGLRHNDLRTSFFEAFPNAHLGQGEPDVEKMKDFLDLARGKVNSPKQVTRHAYVGGTKITLGSSPEGLYTDWDNITLSRVRVNNPKSKNIGRLTQSLKARNRLAA